MFFLLNGALSRASIDINHVDKNGRTAIHEAVINGSEAIVHSLIQKSIQISVPDSGGRTPLMYAAEEANEIRLPRRFKGWRVEDQSDERQDPASRFVQDLNLYIRLLQHDVYRADKILMAVSITPNGCSELLKDRGPYIDLRLLRSLLELLRWSYGPIDFGGVVGWEYSPAQGSTTAGYAGGNRSPWIWVKETIAILESVFLGGG